MQALILSAGLGTRLKPFTTYIPKPLFPFFDSNILELNYLKVKKISSDVAINVYHLPEAFESFLNKHSKIHIAKENPILGTGGAIRNLDNWLKKGEEDLFVCNADIISNADFEKLYFTHKSQKNSVTMLMLPTQLPNTSPVAIGIDQSILGIGENSLKNVFEKHTKHTYACALIMKTELIPKIPKGFGDLWPAVHYAIANHLRVKAVLHEGMWEDIGTPRAFFDFTRLFAQQILANTVADLELFGFRQNFTPKSFEERYISYDPGKSGSFCLSLKQNFWTTLSTSRHHFQSCVFLGDKITTVIPEDTKFSLISDRDIVSCTT